MFSSQTYLVYMHISPCGKAYIGQTKDYKERCRALKKDKRTIVGKAIQLYGWNNFKHEILKDDLKKEDALYWEDFYIKKFNTMYPNGFNKKLSTEYSETSKKQMSESAKGRTAHNKGKSFSEKARRNMSIAAKARTDNRQKGIKFSDEHKAKLSIARKKRITTDETRAKMSASLKGKKRSPESIARYILAAQKRAHDRRLKNDSSTNS